MVQACECLQEKANVGLDRSSSIPCENSPKIAAEAAVERVLTSLQTTTTNHLAESARSGFWIDDDGVARPIAAVLRVHIQYMSRKQKFAETQSLIGILT